MGGAGLGQEDSVFPRVCEIVLIVERVLGIGQQFIERAFAFVDGQGVVELEAWVGERLVLEGELVEVAVGPAHGNLQDGVKPTEMGVAGDQQVPPNPVVGVLQGDRDKEPWG